MYKSQQRGAKAENALVAVILLTFALAACGQKPEAVDTTLVETKSADPKAGAEAESDEQSISKKSDVGQLPKITSSWLVGTWAAARNNPKNDPNGTCETDVIIQFNRDGTFSDAGAEGRFSTDGRTIRYFARKSVPDIAADPDEPFVAEELEEFSGQVHPTDANTFNEDGELWRRCRSG